MTSKVFWLFLSMGVAASSVLAQEETPRRERGQQQSDVRACHRQVSDGAPLAKPKDAKDKRPRMRAMAACLKAKHEAAAARWPASEAQ